MISFELAPDHSFLRRACRVKSSIPTEVVFQLSVTRWHDFWWRQVLSFWNAMAQADPRSIINIVLHDAIAIAQNECSYGWAAQVFRCFAEHGKSSPLVAGARVEVQPDNCLFNCSTRPPLMLCPWTLGLALALE